MTTKTKILILQHDPANITLLQNELDRSFKDYTALIVNAQNEYENALDSFVPDVILSDYSHPVFDWNTAFQLKQKLAPEIPFILIAGTGAGEDALELVKNGVTDYVFKDKPGSLVPKIVRALSDCGKRELRRVERQTLEKGINNLRAIFENTEVGFLFLDTDYKVIAYNHISSHWAANVFGVELKERINFKEVLLPEHQVAFCVFSESVLSGNALNYEASYPRADGALMWLIVDGKPIKDPDGKIIGMCIGITDITARKTAEAELRNRNGELEARVQARTSELTEANAALEAFSYSVSHDLRSPVRSLMGFAKIINKDYGHSLNNEVKELFSHIESSSKRMNSIIDDLLLLAKSAKEQLRSEEVDITALFKKVWARKLYNNPNNVTFQLPQIPSVYADISMLEQVIVNLLSNAIKYSSKNEKPQIEVGFTQTEEAVTVYIKDNGVGFDMKFYDKLFGAFQRLHGVSEFEGTGVGLLLVKRIIERHGGLVWAEGKVNEGATFYFSLPVAEC